MNHLYFSLQPEIINTGNKRPGNQQGITNNATSKRSLNGAMNGSRRSARKPLYSFSTVFVPAMPNLSLKNIALSS